MVLVYLIEPMLFRMYRVFDGECLEATPEAAELRKSLGYGFMIARKHFLDSMLPWQMPACPQNGDPGAENPEGSTANQAENKRQVQDSDKVGVMDLCRAWAKVYTG